jgi:enoyl-CoA hydratase
MKKRDGNVTQIDKKGKIAFLRMNRPEVLNALSSDLQEALADALADIEKDDEIRVAVLSGNGRAFSAGYDLSESIGEMTPLKIQLAIRKMDEFALTVWNFSKPLIAAVHGHCLGGGCEIAMLCDITIADEATVIGEPEIRFGTGSTLVMPWLVSMKAAKELLFSGSTISAQRAYELGIVNQVVPTGSVLDAAERKAKLLAEVPIAALVMTKRGINHSYSLRGFQNAVEYHSEMVTMMMLSPSEELNKFVDICNKEGVKEAAAWQKRRFTEFE